MPLYEAPTAVAEVTERDSGVHSNVHLSLTGGEVAYRSYAPARLVTPPPFGLPQGIDGHTLMLKHTLHAALYHR